MGSRVDSLAETVATRVLPPVTLLSSPALLKSPARCF